jgi:hypothetical protein
MRGFLFCSFVELCADDRLKLYLGDSLRKSNWCYRLKMPLGNNDQPNLGCARRLRYSVVAIGS